nr:hypothetical protein [Bacteroidia bacterium]
MKKLLAFVILSFIAFQMKSQCTTGASIGTLSPLITWQTIGVTAGAPAFRSFNAVSGVTYTFTYCQGGGSYGGDPYLTISNNVPVALVQNDDFCGLGSQIIWTCPATGVYRLYLSGCCPCSNAPAATLAYRGSSNPFPPAPNDDCVSAFTVSVPGLAVGTTTNAYTETVTLGACTQATVNQPGVWYTVVGNGNKFGADLCSNLAWDSNIFVYSGNCGSLTCVTSNNDNGPLCAGVAASATWCSVPSSTYYILVTGNTTPNSFTLAMTETVVGAPPTVSVSATSPSFCPNFPASFVASGAQIYQWSTGANTATMSVVPPSISVYTVTGWSAATCGSDTKTVTFGYHPIPNLTVSISQPSVCTGNTVVTLASGASTYTWSHGVPNGAPLFPSSTTMYTVTGTSALGCTAQAMVGVTVEVTPILAPVASPTVICIGGSGTITAMGANNYTWMPGNFNTSSIVITPTITTTYTLTKANVNCVDVKTITVFVNQLPNVFAISSSSVVCAGSSATLSAGGANSYTWTPSPFNLTGNNVTVSPSVATVYTCTGSDGTCVAT